MQRYISTCTHICEQRKNDQYVSVVFPPYSMTSNFTASSGSAGIDYYNIWSRSPATQLISPGLYLLAVRFRASNLLQDIDRYRADVFLIGEKLGEFSILGQQSKDGRGAVRLKELNVEEDDVDLLHNMSNHMPNFRRDIVSDSQIEYHYFISDTLFTIK